MITLNNDFDDIVFFRPKLIGAGQKRSKTVKSGAVPRDFDERVQLVCAPQIELLMEYTGHAITCHYCSNKEQTEKTSRRSIKM